MNNRILIIDPAWSGPTGYLTWSWSLDGPLTNNYKYGTLKSKEAKAWTTRFDLLQGVETLVIENTYLKYIKAYAALERAKMLWTQAAIDHFGLTEKDIIEVSPQTWQSGLQRDWKVGRDKDPDAIRLYVLHRWFAPRTWADGSCPQLTEHELSCFGMLSWYLDKHVRPF